jgi:HK97 family phage prohead protease
VPYFISDSAEGCDGWATVKDDGEVMGCHMSKEDAIAQGVAIAEAEGSEFMGERSRVGTDIFTTEQEALDRAEQIGCEGTHTMTLEGDTVYMPCSTHGRYEELLGSGGYRSEHDEGASTPAPEEDQIEGSDVNEPGSASGAGGDIELSEATETALRNKVRDHNDAMEEQDKPAYTRTTYGQLSAVYRRGAGAYSTSHRPGVSRGAWAMARVNAYLYLLRNGRPENSAYVTDNDLLPEDHPRSTRNDDRDVHPDPPQYMRASARRGLEWHREGLSGDGLQDATVREARAMARGNISLDKWARIAGWIPRHIDDLDAPAASPDHPDYPSPGVVAMALWGAGVNKRQARRTLEFAERVVARIEEANDDRSNVTGQAKSKFETRQIHADLEVRETGNGMLLEGYAARFNEMSEPLPFREKIAPGAFRGTLQSRNDVKLLWNHDSNIVLGSLRSGTLRLREDDHGLRVEADLPPTVDGDRARVAIQRGDVTGFSFGFTVPSGGDSWSDDGSERTLHAVRLFEVSTGVAFPAYPTTDGTATVRGLDAVAERAEVDADALADAVLKIENGEEISAGDRELIETVLQELAPVEEDPAASEDEEKARQLLQLKKKKLQLLMGV